MWVTSALLARAMMMARAVGMTSARKGGMWYVLMRVLMSIEESWVRRVFRSLISREAFLFKSLLASEKAPPEPMRGVFLMGKLGVEWAMRWVMASI